MSSEYFLRKQFINNLNLNDDVKLIIKNRLENLYLIDNINNLFIINIETKTLLIEMLNRGNADSNIAKDMYYYYKNTEYELEEIRRKNDLPIKIQLGIILLFIFFIMIISYISYSNN